MTEIHPDLDFKTFLEAGRFMIQRGRSSGRYVFYPRIIEPSTGADDLEWVEASGFGTVYSTTVIRAKPPAPNYNVALIDLAEGPRIMSRVEGVLPEEVKIGMQVRSHIKKDENQTYFIVFEPV